MARHITRRMILLSGVAATMLLSRTAMSAWPMVTVHKDPNMGDRASVVLASPDEISRFITPRC